LGNQPHEGEEHCAARGVAVALDMKDTAKQSFFHGQEGHPTLGTGGTVQRRDSLEACPQIFQ
jgi:hypothetical protein